MRYGTEFYGFISSAKVIYAMALTRQLNRFLSLEDDIYISVLPVFIAQEHKALDTFMDIK